MPDYTPTSVADMRAVFPDRPETIQNEPTLLELLRVLKYLMDCSQTHETSISDCNLLFLCIPPELYATYTNTAYPLNPMDPGVTPTYFGANDAAARATVKAQFENAKKLFIECKHMNKALTEEFLALVSSLYTKEFRAARIGNPNMSFRDVFQQFLTLYGESDENDRKLNKDRMEMDWHPNDGIQKLISNIADGIEYAHFARQAIPDAEAIDIGIRVIMRCGLFAHDYELWQQEHDKSWLNFKIFWKNRAKLKKKTVRAGQLGFGMNAEEVSDEESKLLFEKSVGEFGQAHAATQAAMQALTENNGSLTNNVVTSIAALQQQMNAIQTSMQHFAMAGANRTPAAPAAATQYQAPPQNQAPPQQYYPPPQYQQQQQTQYQTPNYFGGRGSGRGGGGRGGRGGRAGGGRGGRGGRGGYAQPPTNQGQYFAPPTNQRQQFTAPPSPHKRFENDDYCHTHGADLPGGHNSSNCGRPGPNHQYAATRSNAMGGSSRGSHKTIMPSGRICLPCVGCAPPRGANYNNNQQWGNY